MPELKAELEIALIDALAGDPWGPRLAGRLKREAKAVLMRHGLGRARIEVNSQGDGVQVDIALPPNPKRVREIRLRLGRG